MNLFVIKPQLNIKTQKKIGAIASVFPCQIIMLFIYIFHEAQMVIEPAPVTLA